MIDDCTPQNSRVLPVDLHQRARQLIAEGVLPRVVPLHIYAGYGSQRECQLCGAVIGCKDVEYELEFADGEQHSGRSMTWVHAACHTIWDCERTGLG